MLGKVHESVLADGINGAVHPKCLRGGSQSSFRRPLLGRDIKCLLPHEVNPVYLRASHLIPKKLGLNRVRYIIKAYCKDKETAAEISESFLNIYDPRLGFVVDVTCHTLIDNSMMGFKADVSYTLLQPHILFYSLCYPRILPMKILSRIPLARTQSRILPAVT